MSFRFDDLKVWHRAVQLSNNIDPLVFKFPGIERFSLSSPMNRSADSVVLNVAEGNTGQTIAEFRRFLNMALRSAIEVVTCLFLAQKRNCVTEKEFKELYDALQNDYLIKRFFALKLAKKPMNEAL